MTLREATALILLYRACRDEALSARARELVPELAEMAGELRTPQCFIMTVCDKAGQVIGTRHLVCRPNEVIDVADRYLREFPGVGFAVSYREAP